ncbi:ATP-dependent zinc protease [Desulfobaculum sp. SPO524]|uniref:ATP-dependent zinc protease family protein n=1 Tax=Desulfobaculum sp. SPO524 TaxID=3378071 RepID=UPI0038543ED0
MRHLRTFFLLITLILLPCIASAADTDPIVAGWTEYVLIMPPDDSAELLIHAKLDTGAKTSSLHAEDIRVDEEEGRVHFTYVDKDGARTPMTCPLIDFVRIKRRPEGYHRRPVVRMLMRFGDRTIETPVNLADRSHFTYRLLVGRRVLSKGILVDSSKTNILPRPKAGL